MKISQDILKEIINTVDIASVIKNYIPVVKKGRNSWAVCPFHEDSNPSLSISNEKHMYKCFTCNESGNVFNFVQNFENCSFMESVKTVCEISGYSKIDWTNMNLNSTPIDPELSNIWKVNLEAHNYYKYLLKTDEGKVAQNYLKSRGMNDEILERFDIGFAPKNSKIIDYLAAKGFDESELYKAGLISEGEGRIYPNLRGRVTFAIRDKDNNIIGFSGRVLDDSKPKYINTPETKAFKKGNFLYNSYHAIKEMRKDKKAIILEGFMDVIALHKAGIKNAVATMGTAFTKDHASLLKGKAKTLLSFMDGDNAGLKATASIIKMASNYDFEVKVIKPLPGMDADEIIEKYGTIKLQEMISESIPAMEFLILMAFKEANPNSIEGRIKFIESTVRILRDVKSLIQKTEYIKMIADLINQTYDDISHYYIDAAKVKKKKVAAKVVENIIGSQNDKAERYLLQEMIHHSEAVEIYKKELNTFSNKEYRTIATFLVAQLLSTKEVNPALLLAELQSEMGETNHINIVKTLIKNYRRRYFAPKAIYDYINIIKKHNFNTHTLKEIRDKINQSNDPDEIKKLLELKSKIRIANNGGTK